MSSPIGGFMPIPLAMMMPFMAAQSMLMGDAFGKGFQFGKRKISALSNEEFNQLDMSAMVSNMQTEFKNLVPTLQQSIRDSKQVQNVIIDEMIKIVPEFLKFMTTTAITTATTGISQTGEQIAHALGTHIGHSTGTDTSSEGSAAVAPPVTSRRTPTDTILIISVSYHNSSKQRTTKTYKETEARFLEQWSWWKNKMNTLISQGKTYIISSPNFSWEVSFAIAFKNALSQKLGRFIV